MHSDPDTLAMIAMGETDIPGDDRQHVGGCRQCSREIASLRRIPDIARAGVPDGPLAAPSARVWARVSDELALSPDIRPAPFEPTRAASASPWLGGPSLPRDVLVAPAPTAPAPTGPVAVEPAPGTPPVSRAATRGRSRARSRARRRWIPLLAAAAVVAISGGIAATVVLTGERPATVLADVPLEALPDWGDARGEAVLEQSADGTREVVVNVDLPTGTDGYREVWLLTPDLSGLISIGVLTGDEATFALPDDVDLTEYSVVDVSEERLDGDPAHSGDSIVRGTLDI
ncbi:MAG: hypothetical protein RI885_2059 [Actinomycetota bacterium]|jgi:hypothetical protein